MNKKQTVWVTQQVWRERELLLLKLNEVDLQLSKAGYDYRFVVVENTRTFTGATKTLFYTDVWSKEPEFEKFSDRIVPIVMDGFGDEDFRKETAMRNDFIQKCAVEKEIEKADPDDVVVVTDCDEIPDFRSILSFFDGDLSRIDKIYTLNLKLYYYFYNVKASFEDDRVTVSKKKDFKGVSAHRAGPSMGVPRIYIQNGGWHFSYLGGLESIRTKIQNFGHSELNTPVVMDNLKENFRRLKDPYGRAGCVYTVVPIDQGYPEYFLNNLGKYRSNIYNDMRK